MRVPQNSSEWISKALDGGAQAVIVPHVKSAKEAAKVVQYAKFTPIGERSATSGMPLLRYASIPAREANVIANELTTVICMIETQGAVDDVEWVACEASGSHAETQLDSRRAGRGHASYWIGRPDGGVSLTRTALQMQSLDLTAAWAFLESLTTPG